MENYYVFSLSSKNKKAVEGRELKPNAKVAIDVIHHYIGDSLKKLKLFAIRTDDPDIETLFPLLKQGSKEYFRLRLYLGTADLWGDEFLPILLDQQKITFNEEQMGIFDLFGDANSLIHSSSYFSVFDRSDLKISAYLEKAVEKFLVDTKKNMMKIVEKTYEIETLS